MKTSSLLNKKKFFLHTVLPVLLAITMFVILIFAVIVPYVEYHLINGKKEIIREQTASAISLIRHFDYEAAKGNLSLAEAQKQAIRQIGAMRYGISQKDYFWITDTTPRMILHPYRSDLEGQDLSDFADPEGKKLFLETVLVTAQSGEGFVHYQWQWMDDSLRIVPKISFVKRYAPWGWIIGTGIYIEDVREEIAGIKEKLAWTMLGIAAFIALLLIYNVRQQLQTELKRLEAEEKLRLSRERYKTLVESSADGSMILSGSWCIYANPVVREKFNIHDPMQVSDDLRELIAQHRRYDMERIAEWRKSEALNLSLETQLIGKDGNLTDAVLSFSKGKIANQDAVIVTVKDMTVPQAESTTYSRDEWLQLSESFGIGFFRAQPGRRGKIISANTTTVRLFGFPSAEDLYRTTILDLIPDVEERKRLMRALDQQDGVVNYRIRLMTYDRRMRYMEVTALTKRNASGIPEYVEGIIRDVTDEQQASEEQKEWIALTEVPWRLWNQPVNGLALTPVCCSYLIRLSEAASYMTAYGTEVVVVTGANGEHLGVLTESVFRDALARRFVDPQQPVFEWMKSPLLTLFSDEPLWKAAGMMEAHGSDYVAVKNLRNEITGVITKKQLAGLFSQALRTMDYSKKEWSGLESVNRDRRQIERFIVSMLDRSAPAHRMTQWYSEFSGQVTRQIAEWVIQEIGAPPTGFAFIVTGSEARYEQTLLTDQDNALIYHDEEDRKEVREYFLRFGNRMNHMLNDAGYRLCKGDFMAGNPKWCQTTATWKKYFTEWVQNPEPQAILETSVFFDFRFVYGKPELVQQLRSYLHQLLDQHPAFFSHLARACMNYRIPVGLFNKIQTDTESAGQLNIKSPMRVLTHIVRLYALHHRIEETNTIKRIDSLYARNALPAGICREMREAYEYLLYLQLRSQCESFRRREPLSHLIQLSDLTDLETDRLVSVFNRIAMFQSAIGRDFHLS